MMRVLHVISCLVKSDGHSQFCMTLAERMVAQGMEQEVFALPSGDGEALPDPKGLIHYAAGRPLRVLNVSVHRGLEKQLAARVRDFKPDVIHLHGGWHPVLFFAARVARRLAIPILLSLHGSLRPAVIEGDRRLKKCVAWLMYQRRLVEMADVVHVSTEEERKDLARLGFDNSAVVVPNGVNAEDVLGCAFKGALAQQWPECGGKRKVLFLSRIHPLKGLDLLVSAWAKLAGEFPGWHLLIAGPDENGYQSKLQRLVRQAGMAKRVTCCGPLYGKDRAMALQSADLFVLPTRSENFGIVVAEALACGVPVITTKGAPWSELLGRPESGGLESENMERNVNRDSIICNGVVPKVSSFEFQSSCLPTNERMNLRTNELPTPSSFAAAGRSGWWIDLGVDPLASALREAMGLTDEERRAMGENGRQLVESKYRWETVAEQMAKVYERLKRVVGCHA